MHDMGWNANGELIGVNTAFSCLCRIDGEYSFIPIWRPHFITDLQSEDRCHLNGMTLIGDHLFIGLSRLRKTHTFGELPLAQRDDLICGFEVVHLPTGAKVSQFQFHATCEEVYDICALPGLKRPGIFGTDSPNHRKAIVLPKDSFWGEFSKL